MRRHQAGCDTFTGDVSHPHLPPHCGTLQLVIIVWADNPDLPHLNVAEVFLEVGPMGRNRCAAA